MSKIVGNTVGIPNPQSDWNQTDSTKADYIKNKPLVSNSIQLWQPNTEYKVGDVVLYQWEVDAFAIMLCKTNHTSNEWFDDEYWSPFRISSAVQADFASEAYIAVEADYAERAESAGYAEIALYDTRGNLIEEAFLKYPDVTDDYDSTQVSFYANDNAIYNFGTLTSLNIIGLAIIRTGFSITFTSTSGETSTSFIAPTGIKFSGIDCADGSFVPTENKIYNIIITQVGNELWGDVGAREVVADA